MKTKQSNLIADGKTRLENTDDFRRKVEQIKMDVIDQYAQSLLVERNWVRRMLILIRRELEIRRRASELSSIKNLHLAHSWQM